MREGLLYPYKIPSNFHGCTTNLSALRKGGFEDELYIHYFLTHIITKNYINGFPDVTPDLETIFTCGQNLWDRESDMLFGELQLVVEEISNAGPIFPYFVAKLN